MTINPADVLLDKLEELEQEKLRREQFVDRHAGKADKVEHCRQNFARIKRIGYDIRALKRAIDKLNDTPPA